MWTTNLSPTNTELNIIHIPNQLSIIFCWTGHFMLKLKLFDLLIIFGVSHPLGLHCHPKSWMTLQMSHSNHIPSHLALFASFFTEVLGVSATLTIYVLHIVAQSGPYGHLQNLFWPCSFAPLWIGLSIHLGLQQIFFFQVGRKGDRIAILLLGSWSPFLSKMWNPVAHFKSKV